MISYVSYVLLSITCEPVRLLYSLAIAFKCLLCNAAVSVVCRFEYYCSICRCSICCFIFVVCFPRFDLDGRPRFPLGSCVASGSS